MTSVWLDHGPQVPTDPFADGADYDAVVVGAGLTGLTTAVLLARAGHRVAVLEARQPGAVTTGNTTGKLTLLQGTQLSKIVSAHSEKVAGAYLDGNREALTWVLDYCTKKGVRFDRRDCWTYAGSEKGVSDVQRELEVARKLGLGVTEEVPGELPYQTHAAIRLPDQAQLYPVELLAALARELRELGGVVISGQRVHKVDGSAPVAVHADGGSVTAERVVLASGIPFLDRGLYFAKVSSSRSYALAFTVPGEIPQGMYVSADEPTRSLRTATIDGTELLLVGGNGHEVGRQPKPTSELVADLVHWTEQNFPRAQQTHTWSAQDYVSANAVPFVGKLPRGGGSIYLATGYSKWGMTNAAMAALMISGQIAGEEPEWAKALGRRISMPVAAAEVLRHNLSVGVGLVRGWAGAQIKPLPAEPTVGEGEGVVGARGGKPVAVSTVDGQTCALSAVCTHLGGIVTWNDLERSWDCPLHGSRFAADGTVLEGPATEPLSVPDNPG